MPSRSILDRLKGGEVLVLDGGTGSELQRRGVDVNKGSTVERRPTTPHKYATTATPTVGSLGVWSAAANLDAPDVVRKIHEDYLDAGAEIVTSNNFYTSRSMMAVIGEEDRWVEYARRGGELAVEARNAVNPEAYVAGGFAPFKYSQDLRKEFEDVSGVLARAGVDFLLPEFLGGHLVLDSPIGDCVTAAEACAKTNLPVFLGICEVTEKGTMHRGESFAELVAALKGRRVDGILLMCSSPSEISASLPELRKAFDGPVGAYAEVGYDENPRFGSSPDEPFWLCGTYGITPEQYAGFAREWKEMGAQIIGGCCATGPEHIRAIRPVVKG
ncbi:MAG: homocysteine S-methyltransferase family protein [Acidobacteriota bacterium]|nr:MAG: homocysteine S-methyltransferase family protein [Acidobacteriota bacterium]